MFSLHEEPSNSIDDLLEDFEWVQNNKKIHYLNVASAFDIESTSFIDEEKNKVAIMYAFTFNLNGKHIIGRTWNEFNIILNKLTEYYHLDKQHRMIIYIHNLSYEFQFFRKRIKWDNVFLLDNRKPVYALSTMGIEFRCSYILTGYSLNTLSNHLSKYKISKMVGDLDYSLIRNDKTELSDKELKYIYHDGLVVVAYIQEQIELEHNNISNIPLTKTGYVRRYVRNECLYDGSHSKNSAKYLKYRKIINSLTITSVNEYLQTKNGYLGAHTHANPLAVNTIIKNVFSLDFTSSYPYVMLSEPSFPMSKGKRYTIKSKEDFEDMINTYCCIFDITFYNIESTTPFEHLIPSSRCVDKLNAICDNGKIVKADKITMTLNEVDFKNFRRFYKWDKLGIMNFRYYMKGYLPKDVILSILHLYKNKTELKGVEGKEVEYMSAKENLNSVYGMCVTDICKDTLIYNDADEFETEECDYEKNILKYNKSKNRVLFYIWGMYVTSLAKYNLCDGILELKEDYLYADTDSVKCINYLEHEKFFTEYNKNVKKKLLAMCKFYKINPSLIEPKNINGESKLIGIWDKEFKDNNPTYKQFKTLGSKRYMYQYYEDNTFSFTISGCSKHTAIPYLCMGLKSDLKTHELNFNPLDKFNDNMYIPEEYTGKKCHTYFDYEISGEITDYKGKTSKYQEFSGVNILPIDFTLSLSSNFMDYLLGLRGVL